MYTIKVGNLILHFLTSLFLKILRRLDTIFQVHSYYLEWLLHIDNEANAIRNTEVTEINTMSKINPQEAMQKWTGFKELYDSKTDNVNTNETKYFAFAPSYDKTIGSDGFDGCFGVVITSFRGCIVSHMTPTNNALADAELKINEHYNNYPGILANEQAYIYAQVNFQDQSQLKHPVLYERLSRFVQSVNSNDVAPILVKYLDPQDVCKDSDGLPLQGFDGNSSEYGRLVIKCGKDQSSLPTVRFITPEIQYHAARV